MSNNKKEESRIVSWAEKEIQIACENERRGCESEEDASYGIACYQSALKALKSLAEDEHSGHSIAITKHILNRLIDSIPLTPIYDTEDVWNLVHERDNENGKMQVYQCTRCPRFFKDVDTVTGETTYNDVERVVGIDGIGGTSYTSGLISGIYDELFPITMPYMPPTMRAKMFTEEFLFDQENGGDFDTEAVLYVITPDGDKIEINRFFKEPPKDSDTPEQQFYGWIEITEDEYNERKSAYEKRVSETKNIEEMENNEQ